MKLDDANAVLETSQHVAKSLKEKLGECSKQLRDYETERDAVIEVLDKHGVDTRGLLAGSDTSGSIEDSVIDQDLADAVAKLGNKLLSVQAQVQSYQASSNKSQSRARDLEERVISLTSEVEEGKAQKQMIEKRLENLRVSSRTVEEQTGVQSAELDNLRQTISTLQGELDFAQVKLRGNVDTVSSEIQALEEENIELMKENKELRKEAAGYRIVAERLQNQYGVGSEVPKPSVLSAIPSTGSKTVNVVKECPVAAHSDASHNSENIHPNKSVDVIRDQKDHNSVKKATVIQKVIPESAQKSVEPQATEVDASKGRRVRTKAKAMVSDIGAEDGAGECNQS